jgi:hypothetical protein
MTKSLSEVPAAPVVDPRPWPLERLEAEIVELSSQLTAATSRLLGLVGEFDAVEGWRQWGMRSTAHWLSWQCGVGLTAGREQVRVGRALRSLPLVAAEFAAGRLSYSKVRAVSRVATAETEETLVEWALHATAAQLDRLVGAQRRVVRTAEVRARHEARYLSWRWDDDGSLVGSFRLPPEQAVVLLQALEVAKGELTFVVPAEDAPAEASPVDPANDTPAEALPVEPANDTAAEASRDEAEAHPAPASIWDEAPSVGFQFDRAIIDAFAERYAPPGVERETPAEASRDEAGDASAGASPATATPRSVDALVQIATGYLDSKRESASPGQSDRYQLVLHATAEQLGRDDDESAQGITTDEGIRLHPETARRLTCDCPTSTLTDDEHGNPLHLGRRTRRIRGRVARAVRYRDHGRCQAPGCTAAATITHHIRHWARGGPTCLINLISLCDGHHWLVHDGGWRIAVIRPGAWRFYAPDGRRLDTDRIPTRAGRSLPVDPTIAPDAVTGHWTGEPLDIHYATSVLNQGIEPESVQDHGRIWRF